jgi:hypothetical protein
MRSFIISIRPQISIRQMKSRRMRCAGHVARIGESRKVYKVLVGKPEGKRTLGRPKRSMEGGIRMDLSLIGTLAGRGGGVDSIGSGQGPVTGSCEHGGEPSVFGATELLYSNPAIISYTVTGHGQFWGSEVLLQILVQCVMTARIFIRYTLHV